MKTRYFIYLLVVVFVTWVLIARLMHVAKISVKVVAEDGRPVEGAKIELCFYGGCLTKDSTIGTTDKNGSYSAVGSSRDGATGGGVEKTGYYKSVFSHDFFTRSSGMWQPWNKQIKVVLRPIVNPVPMYVRNRWFDIPVVGKEIGFDLSKFDWVSPYGKGAYPDFVFEVERNDRSSDDFDATLTLNFPRKYDGIQVVKDNRGGDFSAGSRFRLPRQAPEDGYQKKLVKRISQGAKGWHYDKSEDNNYIFRVRSEVDKDGRLKRAMYGKIWGDISFDPRGSNTASIHMLYFLNPDYTRNLEFDIKRNLFRGLPEGEGVGLP
jgi:hypothetical protein